MSGSGFALTLVAAASAAALGFAWWVEKGLGIVPCELCLLERWPYRLALLLALAGLLSPASARTAARGRLVVLGGLGLTLAASVGLAFLHVGVEQQLWQSPFPECRAPRLVGGSVAEQLAAMPLHAAKPCDAATYLIPHLPLSMAGLNLCLSLLMLAVVLRDLAGHRARVAGVVR